MKAGGLDFPHKLFALIALFAVTSSALINIMMASRLCYGMANERIPAARHGPGAARPPHPRRRHRLRVAARDRAGVDRRDRGLGDTTAFLLLCVFAVVNVAVLVLRKDRVEHRHFRTPTVLPVLGAVTALILASPLADRPAEVYVRAGVLVAIGIALWAVNKLVMKARTED